MAQETPKGFLLYYDYRQHLALLTDEERGKLLMALMDYGESGAKPELEGAALMAFSFIASQIERDAQKYQKTSQERSKAGKKGGRPPKSGKGKKAEESKESNSFSEEANQSKESYTNTNTNINTSTNTSTSINTENTLSPLIPQGGKEREGDESDGYCESFNAFWGAYPKQVGEAEAREAWQKIPADTPLPDILAGLERAKKDPEWIREGGRFIPYPAKWINGRRWNDKPTAVPEAAGATVQQQAPKRFDALAYLSDVIAAEEGGRTG